MTSELPKLARIRPSKRGRSPAPRDRCQGDTRSGRVSSRLLQMKLDWINQVHPVSLLGEREGMNPGRAAYVEFLLVLVEDSERESLAAEVA